MKKLCNIITYIAAFAFCLALCSIETLEPGVLFTLMLSGLWLAVASMVYAEKRRVREGRR